MSPRFFLLVLLSACGRHEPPPAAPVTTRAAGEGDLVPIVHRGKAMGSDLAIEIYSPDRATGERALSDALAEIEAMDKLMTDWKPVSPLMDINYAAGKNPVAVPPELFFIIQRSVQISEMTDGAFDISYAGAGKLWNWRAPNPTVPDPSTIREALRNVGWKGILLDETAQTVFLSRPGMRIGLGGIGPGYAGDRAMGRIKAHGVRNAMVDMSGDVLLMGKRGREPWRIGIKHPRKPETNLAVLPVTNAAVSTSGDYERFFMKDGKRYCHIIDPRTGYPADLCQSVTIVAPVLALADALATGVFVLGPKRGLDLLERIPGVEAVIVAADGTVHRSRGLAR